MKRFSDKQHLRRLAGCALLEATVSKEDLQKAIFKLISSKKKIVDDDVHSLANRLSISIERVEDEMYMMLKSFASKFGKHNDVPDDKFDPEQLKKGIAVEQEHTNDPFIAKLIAKDHLSEVADYYSRLEKMEKSAGIE